MDTPSDQYRTSTTLSKSSYYDPSVVHTNAEMPYQNQLPSSFMSQQAWQGQPEQQHIYSMQLQHQEQLHIRGQGRGSSHDRLFYPPDHQGKTHLPLVNIDNHQPRLIQPGYDVTGTNAAPMQRQFLPNQSPLVVTRRSEQPTHCASEAINEEIRYQADRQRRHQDNENFDSTLQLDPYMICPKCQLQFREGQLSEYRDHIYNCLQ